MPHPPKETSAAPASIAQLILVIDDEPAIRRVVRNAFDGVARVIEATTAVEGIDVAAAQRPDVIILDLGLPDQDGLEVCREIRRWTTVPIVVLSARHADEEKIALLDAGADDYLTKPFSTSELQARVRAVTRRSAMADAPDHGRIAIGALVLDIPARVLTRDGELLHLTPIEWGLLRVLMTHAGRVLTHQQLLPRGLEREAVRRCAAIPAGLRRASASQDRVGRGATALHHHRTGSGVPLRHQGRARREGRCMNRPAWQRWVVGSAALAATTFALIGYRDRLDKAHVTLAYLLVILLASVSGGRRLGFALAGTAFLLFNWFFLRPYGTFRVNDPLDWSILVVFVIVSAVAAQMLHRLQREAIVARQRAEEVNQFAVLGAETLGVARAEDALRAVAETIRANLHLARCEIHAHVGAEVSSTEPLISWVLQNGRSALRLADDTTHIPAGPDAFEEALPEAKVVAWLLPLVVRDQVVGVLELIQPDGMRIATGERRFLRALSYYAALAIERAQLARAADHADALREADRMKDALLASVSHDLRTPLTTIMALAHDLAASDDRALVIEEEAARLNRMVADLLDLSRIQAGALPVHLAFNAVDDLVGALMQRISGLPVARQLRVELPPASTLLVGRFDFVHALRVLVNLVENAHKYSPPDSSITLQVARVGQLLLFTVADRGPGVADAERTRIFEPFYRPAGAVADSGSAGLGLSIARRLAELQGGSLAYAPRPGGGSEFVLSLAAADLPEGAIES